MHMACVYVCPCVCVRVASVWAYGELFVSDRLCRAADRHTHTRSEQKAPPGSSDICTRAHTLAHGHKHTDILAQHTWHALVWYSVHAGALGCVCGSRGKYDIL